MSKGEIIDPIPHRILELTNNNEKVLIDFGAIDFCYDLLDHISINEFTPSEQKDYDDGLKFLETLIKWLDTDYIAK